MPIEMIVFQLRTIPMMKQFVTHIKSTRLLIDLCHLLFFRIVTTRPNHGKFILGLFQHPKKSLLRWKFVGHYD